VSQRHVQEHGVQDEDVEHAFINRLEAVWHRHSDESVRWVVLGPDRAGNVVESVWIELEPGSFLAVHCQRVRKTAVELIRRMGEGKES
jgi:uncharacterized DUF497 family protein